MESSNALNITNYFYNLFANCFSKNAQLVDKLQLTHDTFLLTFQTTFTFLSTLPCNHIRVKFEDKSRSYTPILWTKNRFCIVVKEYKTNGVSQYLCEKEIGDWIEIEKKTFGKYHYENQQLISSNSVEDASNLVVFIAGTGITPIVPILNNPPKKISILYSNKTHDDLFFADLLAVFNSKLFFTREPDGSRITEEIIINEIHNQSNQLFVICGPYPFTKFITSTLQKNGIPENKIRTF